MSQPPSPRYKIVERDRRLVTIDTWAKVGAKDTPSRPNTDTRPLMAPPPGIPEKLTAAVLRVQDEDGRRLLTTGSNWDRRGPRTIALSPVGEKRLGIAVLVAGLMAAVALCCAIANLAWLFPIAVIAVALASSASTAGAPLVTRFLDSLGETLPA